ncbi:MAG: hypothetical protein WD073_00080 [Xanthobacteraceae bacterium]
MGLAASAPALSGEMKPDEARRFVIGKLFAFNCFEGTRGAGRIYADGSVMGTVQFGGAGPIRYIRLPVGTLRVKNESVCATVRGMPFEPCFNLEQTDKASFRGSVSGFSFAYCDFNRRSGRVDLATITRSIASKPVQSAAASAYEED